MDRYDFFHRFAHAAGRIEGDPNALLASHMLSEGMRDQAFHTARGVYNVVWKDRGYFFRTPEAYDAHGMYRASMYMRPGAIWSMEPAPK